MKINDRERRCGKKEKKLCARIRPVGTVSFVIDSFFLDRQPFDMLSSQCWAQFNIWFDYRPISNWVFPMLQKHSHSMHAMNDRQLKKIACQIYDEICHCAFELSNHSVTLLIVEISGGLNLNAEQKNDKNSSVCAVLKIISTNRNEKQNSYKEGLEIERCNLITMMSLRGVMKYLETEIRTTLSLIAFS